MEAQRNTGREAPEQQVGRRRAAKETKEKEKKNRGHGKSEQGVQNRRKQENRRSDTKKTKEKSKARAILSEIGFYFMLILIVLTVFIVKGSGEAGAPRSIAGYSAFTVLTGSMQRDIPKDSLVITKTVDPDELQVGDDITFMSSETTTVTHRIVDIEENHDNTGQRYFTTQGIMNPEPDAEPVSEVNLVGKVVYHSYILGVIFKFIRNFWLWIIIIGVLLFGFFSALKGALAPIEEEEEPERFEGRRSRRISERQKAMEAKAAREKQRERAERETNREMASHRRRNS